MEFKKLLNFIDTHESAIKKGLDWTIKIGNLFIVAFKVFMLFHGQKL